MPAGPRTQVHDGPPRQWDTLGVEGREPEERQHDVHCTAGGGWWHGRRCGGRRVGAAGHPACREGVGSTAVPWLPDWARAPHPHKRQQACRIASTTHLQRQQLLACPGLRTVCTSRMASQSGTAMPLRLLGEKRTGAGASAVVYRQAQAANLLQPGSCLQRGTMSQGHSLSRVGAGEPTHLAAFLTTFSATMMTPHPTKCQVHSRWGVKRRVGYLRVVSVQEGRGRGAVEGQCVKAVLH